MENLLKVALAQIAPVWLNKKETLNKIEANIRDAAHQKAELIVFGEALLPGYPFWLALTDGASWDNKVNKELHAHYARNAVQIEAGELESIGKLAKENKIAIYLGVIERAKNRGGHSLYCSLVYIDAEGSIRSVHRKLQPTYDERLTWAAGDGNGLQVHPLKTVHRWRTQLLGKLDAPAPNRALRPRRKPTYCRLAGVATTILKI